jgi:hypothetical protein
MTSPNFRDLLLEFELAGMVSEDGTIDRPYHMRRARVPAVITTYNDSLIWRWDPVLEFNPPRPEGKGVGPLLEFVRLADATPDMIFAFARKWGVLEICTHGLPWNHRWLQTPGTSCTPLWHHDRVNFYEPIEAWHFFARQARSLLKVAARLRQGVPGLVEDLDNILIRRPGDPSCGFADMFGQDVYHDKCVVTLVVDLWLSLGDVRPSFVWDEERCLVTFNNTLFGMLASQLMLIISRTEGLGICSGCGETFISGHRWPKFNQRNYCHNCGKRAAWRDAQADRRRRKRSEHAT